MKPNAKRILLSAAFVGLVALAVALGALSTGTAVGVVLFAALLAEFTLGRQPAMLLGALTPSFLFDFESNMQAIVENEYLRLAQNMFWSKLAKVRPSESKRERIAWLLSTAMIRSQGKGGNMQFDDLVATSTEYVNGNAGAGLKLTRDQLEDADGNGLELAAKWAGDIGAYMAYWPQKQVVKAILNGEAAGAKSYDNVSFFSASHPVNPLDSSLPTFQNIFTGAPSGSYPGALPIDTSVTVDTAIGNIAKAIAYIRSIKMPNGEDPRFLRAVGLYVPPALVMRAQQLTNAKFIAQMAGALSANNFGGGSADISSVVSNWGLVQPQEVTEFGAGMSYTLDDGTTVTGSDTSWYLVCEELNTSQLGGLVYVDREPFKISYYSGLGGGSTLHDVQLDRSREFEWHCQGRNVTGYGHPYLIFKCKAT